jgi:hypothetical protein
MEGWQEDHQTVGGRKHDCLLLLRKYTSDWNEHSRQWVTEGILFRFSELVVRYMHRKAAHTMADNAYYLANSNHLLTMSVWSQCVLASLDWTGRIQRRIRGEPFSSIPPFGLPAHGG